MADTGIGAGAVVVRLSDLVHGQEAECFAALVKKVRGTTSRGDPFLKCYFRDKRVTLEAPLWSDHTLHREADSWAEGLGYRLRVRAEFKVRYGLQLDVLRIRPAGPDDAADGYDFYDLVEGSRFPPESRLRIILECVGRYVSCPFVQQLLRRILGDHEDLFLRMPAAQAMHHAYSGGLVEHVWSMTRVCVFLSNHYAEYYDELNPPLNRDIIVAAAILHDIGKLRELAYNPVETKYTKEGHLIGHVLIGRDLVREAARGIEGFPEETLLLLEHAILAHHGRKEFGAPIVPQTLEALILSFVDDLDAKINAVARERMRASGDDDFTDRVYALENRRIYKGIPLGPPADDAGGA